MKIFKKNALIYTENFKNYTWFIIKLLIFYIVNKNSSTLLQNLISIF